MRVDDLTSKISRLISVQDWNGARASSFLAENSYGAVKDYVSTQNTHLFNFRHNFGSSW